MYFPLLFNSVVTQTKILGCFNLIYPYIFFMLWKSSLSQIFKAKYGFYLPQSDLIDLLEDFKKYSANPAGKNGITSYNGLYS